MVNPLMIAAVIIFVLLIPLSAFFSASETAFTSVNKIKLKNLANDGDKRAKIALEIIEDYDATLSTILVGNNMVNILLSSICTWICAQIFVGDSGLLDVLVATLISLTVLLIFGEIMPKRRAKIDPERFALKYAKALKFTLKLLSPIGILFTYLGGLGYKKKDPEEDVTLTEEELVVMIDQIEDEGTLEEAESELIKSAIKFDDKPVSDIITPRVDIVGINKDATMEELKNILTETGFSRIPVYDETIDDIMGVIYAKDFYAKYFENADTRMEDLMRPVKFIPETATVQKALTEIQKSRVQMIVVIDSYGGTVGIVSMEDILEVLVGEIWDESDEVQEFIVKERDGTYTILGDTDIDSVKDTLDIDLDIGEYDGNTIGGFIQYKLNKVTRKWDKYETDQVEMMVILVENHRISKIRAVVKEPVRKEDPEDSQS